MANIQVNFYQVDTRMTFSQVDQCKIHDFLPGRQKNENYSHDF